MGQNKIRHEFVTSDTHFFHKKILEMGRHNFKDLDDMHDAIINNWNKVVEPDDIVYHLGDFSFGNKVDSKAIMNRLNGIKIIVRGNHDGKSDNWFYDVGFSAVVKFMSINKYGYKMNFSHKPKKTKNGVVNLHGHLHRGQSQRAMSRSPQHINVCTELYDYTPVNLKELLLNHGSIKTNIFTKIKYCRKLRQVLADRYPEEKR